MGEWVNNYTENVLQSGEMSSIQLLFDAINGIWSFVVVSFAPFSNAFFIHTGSPEKREIETLTLLKGRKQIVDLQESRRNSFAAQFHHF